MSKMPSLLQGPIALEYGEIATTIRAAKITDPTCGQDCTTPHDGSKGHEAEGSCALIPGREKKEKKEKKDKYAFVPSVPGWSEPPANRV